MLHQQRGRDHPHPVVHPAVPPELAHPGIDDGIAGPAPLPGPQQRRIRLPGEAGEALPQRRLRQFRPVPEQVVGELPPQHLGQEGPAGAPGAASPGIAAAPRARPGAARSRPSAGAATGRRCPRCRGRCAAPRRRRSGPPTKPASRAVAPASPGVQTAGKSAAQSGSAAAGKPIRQRLARRRAATPCSRCRRRQRRVRIAQRRRPPWRRGCRPHRACRCRSVTRAGSRSSGEVASCSLRPAASSASATRRSRSRAQGS